MKNVRTQSGQALLIILLAMAVVLTLALSTLSRSVTDIAVTSSREDAQRAFSAAESGVEQALIAGNISDSLDNQASFNAEVTAFAEGSNEFLYPSEIASGDSITVWFVEHDEGDEPTCQAGGCYQGGSLNVCWGGVGTPSDNDETPAIEVSIYYDSDPNGVSDINSGNFADAVVARALYDPNVVRRGTNSFSATAGNTCTIGTETLEFSTGDIDFVSDLGLPVPCTVQPGCLWMARIRMLYNDSKQPLGVVASGGTLPSQGSEITSTGTAGSSTRKIQVFETFPELPFAMDAAVFSPANLTHQ